MSVLPRKLADSNYTQVPVTACGRSLSGNPQNISTSSPQFIMIFSKDTNFLTYSFSVTYMEWSEIIENTTNKEVMFYTDQLC